MDKVIVSAKKISDVTGYDVAIADPEATVQDYLNALNEAIENLGLHRGRARRRTCKGCDLCCAERLPLTVIDVLRLRAETAPDAALNAWLERYAHVLAEGPVVDITMSRPIDGRCCLLDRASRTCRLYSARPLVCQTFICSPQTKRARRLRDLIVNKGEDQLVREWLLEARRTGSDPVIHEGYNAAPRLKDYPPTPFEGKEKYSQILLRDICTPGLWKELTLRL